MEIKPVTFKEASNFINLNHRHHKATVGCKFCVGLYDNSNTLQSESGISLRASNFVCEGSAGGLIWSGSRCRDKSVPKEKKIRWKRDLVKHTQMLYHGD